MRPPAPRRFIRLTFALSLAFVTEAACREDRPVGPGVPDASFAKGGPSANPSVTSATPPSAPRDTTLNVTVGGSGFEQGSRAVWALNGDTTFAKTKVKTNATTFVSDKQLIASITIAIDATIDLYDVQVVTLSGRKGIGIELFAVTPSVVATAVGPASESSAAALNNAGQVAGSMGVYPNQRAFVWTPSAQRGTSGTLTDIGTLGGTNSYARGMNAAGHVVGGATNSAGVVRPFLWSPAGGITDLGVPANNSSANMFDANESGQAVGLLDGWRPARWSVTIAADGSVQVSSIESLGAPTGAEQTVAWAMNRVGQAVGYSNFANATHAMLWTRDATGWIIEDLGALPGNTHASAQDVNDDGIVVGWSAPSQGCRSAVVWTTQGGRRTGMRALPTLGGCSAEAYGINNQGDVVGRAEMPHLPMQPVLWTLAPDGSVSSVRALGGVKQPVTGAAYQVSERIDNIVQAVGYTVASKGASQATLWTIK